MTLHLDRRACLRGAGAALALPFLEAMLPSTAFGAVRRPAPKTPPRLVYWYVPNGVEIEDWVPGREGVGYDLPPLLEPLRPLKGHVSVLSGLTADKARANGDGPGDHARAAAAFLTGVQPLKGDGQIRLGVSADQLAARALGADTAFPSLALGTEGGMQSGQCDSGYACAYSSNVSWISDSTPLGKETSPRRLFDRLFATGGGGLSVAERRERNERRKSLLDYVAADASRLERRLGLPDRRRLSEFLDGLRELERRLDREEDATEVSSHDERALRKSPRSHAEHVRLMADVQALALRCDSTRVVTFMVANEGSNRSYPHLDVDEGHHSLSHHGGDQAKRDQLRRINLEHTAHLAHFLGALRAAEEGDGTLLDASIVVYGSGIRDGNRHDHGDLPILVCGGGNGALGAGRHTRFPKETPLNDLHLALLRKVGAPAAPFGDATGELSGI